MKETLDGVGPVLRNPTMTSTWVFGGGRQRQREGERKEVEVVER